MPVGIGGILHESNSFSNITTDRSAFDRCHWELDQWRESQHEIAGFLAGCRQFGLDVHATLLAQATPAGPVTDDAFHSLTSELIGGLRAVTKLDGVLLALHGAMMTENFPHADAEIVRRVRQAMGLELPIVVTHDFHANIPPEILKHSTALLTYQTCPHVDQRARGIKAVEVLHRILTGRARPAHAIVKPPMFLNIRFHNTNAPPLAPIVEETRRLEQHPKVLAASFSGGYQYADVPHMGPSVVVVADNDPEMAAGEARRISDLLCAARDQMTFSLPDARQAVQAAMESPKTPVVLVDMGDNIGGGSAGDGTVVLTELLRQNATGWVVVIADPEAVQIAARAGVGGLFRGAIGGKRDRLHGSPVEIAGRVRLLYDGRYTETEIRHGGQRHHDQGLTAVVEAAGGSVVLTTRREPPFSLQQLVSAGIEPQREKILVVKAAVAFRAAYEPIAGEIIEVDTPGVTSVNPERFTYIYSPPVTRITAPVT